MSINATWVLGTVLTLLMQVAFVKWQMRFVRSFDRLSSARGARIDGSADMEAESRA